eukprot:gb/GECH01000547.1/.p1 GENE.gb/GECH01000547.1/~~gb/GECH01000547.1/.p1  ORF type:complete len:521 (+),score=107.09 gb/GECH01000547.1/:1-1563(+)
MNENNQDSIKKTKAINNNSGTSTSVAASPPRSPSISRETDHLLFSGCGEEEFSNNYSLLYDKGIDAYQEEYEPIQQENRKTKSPMYSSICSLRSIVSFTIVAVIVTNLVISSEVSQYVEKGDFNKPYFIVYFNTSWLGFCLPLQILVFLGKKLYEKSKKRWKRENHNNTSSINATTQMHYKSDDSSNDNDLDDPSQSTTTDQEKLLNEQNDQEMNESSDESEIDPVLIESQQQITTQENTVKRLFKEFCSEVENASPDKHHKFYDIILCALPFSILWFFCNFIWFKALPLISVGSSTALYQSATIFVFIFSIFVLKEPFSVLKAISVLICVGGVVMISFSDEDEDKEYPYAIYGDMLMLVSAIMWALYEVLYKRVLGDLQTSAVNFYLGFLGIWNLIILWPGLILSNYAEWEPFALPHGESLAFVLVNAIVSLFLNYFINWGIAYASPLFIRSGVMCSIPAALIYDMIFNGKHANFDRMFGAALIIFGFAAVSIEPPQNRLPKFLKRRTFRWGGITYGLI